MSINLDAALLKKLATMTLRARYVAEGYISGLHQSPLKGSSLEFSQHRPYSHGDELKYLDWKIYGRTDKFYIKQFQEETNIRGYSLIDTSESMGYGSGEVTKLEYATYLSAAITYLMIKQRDSVGMITFSEDIKEHIPPRNFKGHMKFILNGLEEIKAAGKTDLSRSFKTVGKKIKKRSLLIVFSDLLDSPEKIIKSLKYFPYMKNDVIVFHILDPEEIELSQSGTIEYRDMETGEKLLTRPDVIRNRYKERMSEYLNALEQGLRAHAIDYHRIITNTPLDRAITKFMEKRKKLEL